MIYIALSLSLSLSITHKIHSHCIYLSFFIANQCTHSNSSFHFCVCVSRSSTLSISYPFYLKLFTLLLSFHLSLSLRLLFYFVFFVCLWAFQSFFFSFHPFKAIFVKSSPIYFSFKKQLFLSRILNKVFIQITEKNSNLGQSIILCAVNTGSIENEANKEQWKLVKEGWCYVDVASVSIANVNCLVSRA